jgi:hypothetical protein
MQKVELPIEICQAFDRIKRSWRNLLKEEEMNLMFLNVNQIAQMGDLLILKKYAQNNPTQYIKALANGYTISEEDAKKEEIRKWYRGALIRMQDRIDPDGFAKEAIEEVVHYLGANEILADLSPFCRNQLNKK